MEYIISTPEQLSRVLRVIRDSKGLSQKDTGKPVGLLPKTISALENHSSSSSLESFFKLLSALELELVIAPRGKRHSSKRIKTSGIGEW